LSALEILEESENRLLSRKELKLKFKGGSGILTRQGAAEAIATKLGIKKENVQVISLHGGFGVRDINAKAYIFSSPRESKEQLAEYIHLRQLPKEERQKIREERRKSATSQSSSGGSSGASPAKKAE
jgi:ribosomal protein S24E